MDIKAILNKIKWRSTKVWINKYTIAIVAFLIWVLFFDKYNVSTHRYLNQKVEKLQEDQLSYKAKIEETRSQLTHINLYKEKYARERYFMHKPNEEIVVIKKEE
jgi:cell division protein FtsB